MIEQNFFIVPNEIVILYEFKYNSINVVYFTKQNRCMVRFDTDINSNKINVSFTSH